MKYLIWMGCICSALCVAATTQDADINDDDESALDQGPVDEGDAPDEDVIIMEEDED